jgi:hypothetical protein
MSAVKNDIVRMLGHLLAATSAALILIAQEKHMVEKRFLFALFCVLMAGGCVQRTLEINSDPSGAVVWMNDQEIGRTPIRRDFLWYGTYDVQVRKEGYETLNKRAKVIAPWWQWMPIDLLAEFCGRQQDTHYLFFTLKPASTQPANPAEMFAHASELKEQLESSQYTHTPSTLPTTAPSTRPTTRRSHPTSLPS